MPLRPALLLALTLAAPCLLGCKPAVAPAPPPVPTPVLLPPVFTPAILALDRPPASYSKEEQGRWWVAHNREMRRKAAEAAEWRRVQQRNQRALADALRFQQAQALRNELHAQRSPKASSAFPSSPAATSAPGLISSQSQPVSILQQPSPSPRVLCSVPNLAYQSPQAIRAALGTPRHIEPSSGGEPSLDGELWSYGNWRAVEWNVAFDHGRAVWFNVSLADENKVDNAEDLLAMLGIRVTAPPQSENGYFKRWAGTYGGVTYQEIKAIHGQGQKWDIANVQLPLRGP